MEDKELERRFNLWSSMNAQTSIALNDAIRRIERLEESLDALVRTFKAPREGMKGV